MREIMLIIHFLGMIMAVGTIIVFLFSGMARKKLPGESQGVFTSGLFRLNTIGHIGVTLSFISGGYLMTPYWSQLGDKPLLIAKLAIYILLLFTMSMISVASRKQREKKPGASFAKTMNWARISFLLGFAIIVLATYVFR